MARKHKSATDFAEALASEPGLAGLAPALAAGASWAAYGAGLTVLDSIVATGRSGAKVARRHHRAVKALRKLSLAARGAESVIPPQPADANASPVGSEAKPEKPKRAKADKASSEKGKKGTAEKRHRKPEAEPVAEGQAAETQGSQTTA